jgi:hypothetical protein
MSLFQYFKDSMPSYYAALGSDKIRLEEYVLNKMREFKVLDQRLMLWDAYCSFIEGLSVARYELSSGQALFLSSFQDEGSNESVVETVLEDSDAFEEDIVSQKETETEIRRWEVRQDRLVWLPDPQDLNIVVGGWSLKFYLSSWASFQLEENGDLPTTIQEEELLSRDCLPYNYCKQVCDFYGVEIPEFIQEQVWFSREELEVFLADRFGSLVQPMAVKLGKADLFQHFIDCCFAGNPLGVDRESSVWVEGHRPDPSVPVHYVQVARIDPLIHLHFEHFGGRVEVGKQLVKATLQNLEGVPTKSLFPRDNPLYLVKELDSLLSRLHLGSDLYFMSRMSRVRWSSLSILSKTLVVVRVAGREKPGGLLRAILIGLPLF